MKIISFIYRNFVYFALAVLLLLLLFWDLTWSFVPKPTEKQLLSVLVIAFAAFIKHFDSLISKVVTHGESVRHLTIGDAFRQVSQIKNGHIKTLKIYAITTTVMLPIVRDSIRRIDKCQLMLCKFSDNSRCRYAARLNATVSQLVEMWKSLKTDGRIGELEIVYYSDMPCIYTAIIDSEMLMNGCYSPNDGSIHGNDYEEPWLLIAKSKAELAQVTKAQTWYDDYFEYWKKENENTGTQ